MLFTKEIFTLTEDEEVEGEGEDVVGDFEWHGSYNKRNHITLTKSYPDFSVYFWGEINNQKDLITGDWGYEKQNAEGAFKL